MGKKINNLLGKNINKHITEGKHKMAHKHINFQFISK